VKSSERANHSFPIIFYAFLPYDYTETCDLCIGERNTFIFFLWMVMYHYENTRSLYRA
jgi:hypothetical protein